MYTNRVAILNLTNEPSISIGLQMHVRWSDSPDGLAPIPVDRNSIPQSLSVQGANSVQFSFDDSGLAPDTTNHFAVTITQNGVVLGSNVLYRSGKMDELPVPPPVNPNGHFTLIIPNGVSVTLAELNPRIAANLAAAPVVQGAT